MKNLCVFEDEEYRHFLPLTHLRPVCELRCGTTSLLGRALRFYPGCRATLFCREYLADSVKERTGLAVNSLRGDGGVLFLNGRVLLEAEIPLEGGEEIGVRDGRLVYARLGVDRAAALSPSLLLEGGAARALEAMGLKTVDCTQELILHPWDLIRWNACCIERDFFQAPEPPSQKGAEGAVHRGAHILRGNRVRLGEGSVVKPGAVLDAAPGPITIGANVTVHPNAYVEGPVYIGDGTKIKSGAQIHGGSSIGEVCKVGGEIESSIIHACSNKQHFGFMGHSYVGMWCNIGAGTTTSDLKNNYSPVRVELAEGPVDSGLTFFGMLMGDHTKTGIHTMFNTGSVVGIMTSVYGGGLQPRHVPSFSWTVTEGLVVYEVDKAIEDARKVMARRDRVLSPAEERVLRTVFELTRKDRARRGVKERR